MDKVGMQNCYGTPGRWAKTKTMQVALWKNHVNHRNDATDSEFPTILGGSCKMQTRTGAGWEREKDQKEIKSGAVLGGVNEKIALGWAREWAPE